MNLGKARTLGKYWLLGELGRGGMGVVHLAATRGPSGPGKLLVVKELRPDLVDEDGFLPMFVDEARLAARFEHANVVRTYEVGCDGDRHYMAMELLEGKTLHQVLVAHRQRGGELPRTALVRLLSEALLGLHYAHELCDEAGRPLGVVHRDINPHNLFVTYEGRVKVLDFGVAKVSNTSHQTTAGVLKGRVGYMAPEQVRDASTVDRRADIFAVGVMLWEALVGRRLWQGLEVKEVLIRLLSRELPPGPSTLVVGVPPELSRICEKALAPHPEGRYETALAFREDLERYLAGSPEATAPPSETVAVLFAEERLRWRARAEAALRAVVETEAAGPGQTPEAASPGQTPGAAGPGQTPSVEATPPPGSPPPRASTPPVVAGAPGSVVFWRKALAIGLFGAGSVGLGGVSAAIGGAAAGLVGASAAVLCVAAVLVGAALWPWPTQPERARGRRLSG